MADSRDVYIDNSDARILKEVFKNRTQELRLSIERLREKGDLDGERNPLLIEKKVAQLQYLNKIEVEACSLTQSHRKSLENFTRMLNEAMAKFG